MTLSAEQQELRRRGIGGSEIAAVCGLSPWSGPLDVWLSKTGRKHDASTFHMQRGTHLGPGLVTWFAEKTGLQVSHWGKDEQTFQHPKYSIVIATPDALVGEDKVLECKMPSRRTELHWGNVPHGIPNYYIPQGIWEMAATQRYGGAYFAAMVESDIKVYLLHWDEQLFRTMLDAAINFWKSYVVPNVQPPIDETNAAVEYLKQQFPVSDETNAVPDEMMNQLASELSVLRAEKKQLEKKEELVTNRIKEWLGHNASVAGDWGTIYWKNSKDREFIDWQELAYGLGAKPGDIKAHTKTVPGPRSFRSYFRGEK
jgi:putative phage-type endonuclease